MRIPGGTYLALSADVHQRVAEIEGFLEAPAGLALRFSTPIGILGVALVVGARPLGTLLLGRLRFHFGLGRSGATSHPAAR